MRIHSILSKDRAGSWGGVITFSRRYAEWTLWIFGIATAVATCCRGDSYWVGFAFVLDAALLPLTRALCFAESVWQEYPYSPSYRKRKIVSRRANLGILGAAALPALGGAFVLNPAISCALWLAFYLLTELGALLIDDFVENITRDIRKSLSADRNCQECDNKSGLGRSVDESSTDRTSDLLNAGIDGRFCEGSEESTENEVASQRRERFERGERIYGRRLVEFDEGASLAVLHLSFCPPFDGVPTFDSDLTGGEDVEIKASSIQAYGARLEISRRIPTSSIESSDNKVWLDYFAEYASEGK